MCTNAAQCAASGYVFLLLVCVGQCRIMLCNANFLPVNALLFLHSLGCNILVSVCLMANWQDARVVAALYHDLVPRDMPSNARGRSNVGDVNLLFEGYGLFVSARHEYGFRQVLVADSRAAAMESQDLARQVLQQLHVHAPFLPDSGSQCYQHLDDVVEALIGNHLIPSLQSEMSRDFAVGALYGSTDDSLTPLCKCTPLIAVKGRVPTACFNAIFPSQLLLRELQ